MLVVCFWNLQKHLILLTAKYCYQNSRIRVNPKHWFESYLTNCKKVIKIGNILSEKKFITCGVPQGSTIGPILFLLYISDKKFFQNFRFLTILIDKKAEEIEKTCNEEPRHVSEWLNANKLSLNLGKSNLILFRECQTKITYKPDKNHWEKLGLEL